LPTLVLQTPTPTPPHPPPPPTHRITLVSLFPVSVSHYLLALFGP
jgi:hypothetical protein